MKILRTGIVRRLLWPYLLLLSFSAGASPNSWYLEFKYGFNLTAKLNSQFDGYSSKTSKNDIFGYGVLFTLKERHLLGISDNWHLAKLKSETTNENADYTSRLTALDYQFYFSGTIGEGLYLRAKAGRAAAEVENTSTQNDKQRGFGTSIGAGITAVNGDSSESWLFFEYMLTKLFLKNGVTAHVLAVGFTF